MEIPVAMLAMGIRGMRLGKPGKSGWESLGLSPDPGHAPNHRRVIPRDSAGIGPEMRGISATMRIGRQS